MIIRSSFTTSPVGPTTITRCIDCVESAKMASHSTFLPARNKFSHFVYLFHYSPLFQDTNSPVLALHFWFASQLNALFVQLFMFCDYNFIQQHQNALLSALIHRRKKKLVPRSNTKTPNAHHRCEKIRLLCVSQSSSLPEILLSAKENSFTEKFSHSTRPPKSIDIQKITDRTIKCTSFQSDPVTLQFPHIS